MNRAERRRQAKAEGKQTSARSDFLASSFSVSTIKTRLQQATSPTEAQQILTTLVTQGLPLVASEELSAYAAQYHETKTALQGGKQRRQRLFYGDECACVGRFSHESFFRTRPSSLPRRLCILLLSANRACLRRRSGIPGRLAANAPYS